MKPNKALKFFKTRKAMGEAAGVTRQSVGAWFKNDIIPVNSAMILATASGGVLTVDPKLYA